MARHHDIRTGWAPGNWRHKPIAQTPDYPDRQKLDAVEAQLAKSPPLIVAHETRKLQSALARVEAGDAFLFQAGDCAEAFCEQSAEAVQDFLRVHLKTSAILAFGTALPVVPIGRIAGQYAKPRTSPTETVGAIELPSYRGDIINAFEFTAEGRIPDPDRQITAYRHGATTLQLLRAFIGGELSEIENISHWIVEAAKPGSLFHHHREIVDGVVDAFRFMKAWDVGSGRCPEPASTDFYTSHEGLLLGYEQALTRVDGTTGDWYAGSAHFLWIGDRTRQPDHAHVEYFRGISNPIGIKCGPTLSAAELVQLLEILDPDDQPGRITLICRMGAGRVAASLPPLIKAVRQAGRSVIWCCDPMHGNTVKAGNGQKTRVFDDIVQEIEGFFAIHAAEGTHAGGLHLEMTAQPVTECLGGVTDIQEDDLERCYRTYCDPRLNGRQTVELALLVADMLRTRRKQRPFDSSVFQIGENASKALEGSGLR